MKKTYPKYKDSGIAWIGRIPESWKRTKLKRLLSTPITDGPHETPQLLDAGIPFLSAEAIKNNKLNFDLKRGYISKEEHLRFCKILLSANYRQVKSFYILCVLIILYTKY